MNSGEDEIAQQHLLGEACDQAGGSQNHDIQWEDELDPNYLNNSRRDELLFTLLEIVDNLSDLVLGNNKRETCQPSASFISQDVPTMPNAQSPPRLSAYEWKTVPGKPKLMKLKKPPYRIEENTIIQPSNITPLSPKSNPVTAPKSTKKRVNIALKHRTGSDLKS